MSALKVKTSNRKGNWNLCFHKWISQQIMWLLKWCRSPQIALDQTLSFWKCVRMLIWCPTLNIQLWWDWVSSLVLVYLRSSSQDYNVWSRIKIGLNERGSRHRSLLLPHNFLQERTSRPAVRIVDQLVPLALWGRHQLLSALWDHELPGHPMPFTEWSEGIKAQLYRYNKGRSGEHKFSPHVI